MAKTERVRVTRPWFDNDEVFDAGNIDLESDFVCLPNSICLNPPIAHKHTSSKLCHLTPMEFYIFGGVLIAARAALINQRHTARMDAGRTAIDFEVHNNENFKKEWEDVNRSKCRGVDKPAPERRHWDGKTTYKPKPIREVVPRAGARAYKAAERKQPREPNPDGVLLTISKRKLLTLARLGHDAGNYRAVAACLHRLTQLVGTGDNYMPPILTNWTELSRGRMCLHIDAEWIPSNRFTQVLWPAPKRSPAALAAHLLFSILNTSKLNKKEVSVDWMASCLGLDPELTRGVRNQAIRRAFDTVNRLHEELTDGVIRRLWYNRKRIRPPLRYLNEPYTEGMIRIVAEERRQRYRANDGEDRIRGVKDMTKRVLISKDRARLDGNKIVTSIDDVDTTGLEPEVVEALDAEIKRRYRGNVFGSKNNTGELCSEQTLMQGSCYRGTGELCFENTHADDVELVGSQGFSRLSDWPNRPHYKK